MSTQPKVSVIIPVYNMELYIAKALLSIINQSFQNFEIIIVNDWSTDGSWSKICEIKDKKKENIKAEENTIDDIVTSKYSKNQ